MSTLSNVHAAQSRAAFTFDTSALRALFARLVAAWQARQAARAEQRIDGYFSRVRNEHERFLAKATDHYELERLERAWERRHIDTWRM
jgi:hypothetical protein